MSLTKICQGHSDKGYFNGHINNQVFRGSVRFVYVGRAWRVLRFLCISTYQYSSSNILVQLIASYCYKSGVTTRVWWTTPNTMLRASIMHESRWSTSWERFRQITILTLREAQYVHFGMIRHSILSFHILYIVEHLFLCYYSGYYPISSICAKIQ